MAKLKVGILGATGMVGRRFVELLNNHPWFKITVLAASPASAGKTYREALAAKGFEEAVITSICQENPKLLSMILLDASDVDAVASQVEVVFSAVNMNKTLIAGLEVEYARSEVAVVSNNSAHRWTPDVPVIIPEVNPHHTEIIPAQRQRLGTRRGFIAAKPNCSLQSFVPPLQALWDLEPYRVFVSTYQAVSGAGRTLQSWPEITDNIIPYIQGEEEKTQTEPLKIWGRIDGGKIINADYPAISVHCVRVPVSDGHLVTVNVGFRQGKPNYEAIVDRWNNYHSPIAGLALPSSPQRTVWYFTEEDRPQTKLDRQLGRGMTISVGRLRPDPLTAWKFVCLSHNTLRGAAGGAVLMAELLFKQGWLD